MKNHRYPCGLLVCAIWVISAAASEATYESLPTLKVPNQKEPVVTYRLLEKSHQTILGVTLRQNSLADVTKRFNALGPSPIAGFTHGKGICIASAQAGDPTKLLFIAIPVADLHGFVLFSSGSKIRPPEKCAPATALRKEVATPSGIRLGMSRGQIEKVFGKPAQQSAGDLQYQFEILKKFTPKEWFDEFRARNKSAVAEDLYTVVRSDVQMEMVNDRLVSYAVSTTDTY